MEDLKLNEVPKLIEQLENDGDFKFAEELKLEYEYAKIALEGLTFRELLLVFYVGCCYHYRLFNYLSMAKEEALYHKKYKEFLDERTKFLNKFKSGADNV